MGRSISLPVTRFAAATSRRLLAAAMALAISAAIWLALPYDPGARLALVVLVCAIICWVLPGLDDTRIALIAAAALLAGGALPLGAVPGALANPLIGLMAGAFVIAAALARSGLAERLVTAVVGRARSITQLFHGLAMVILASAFVVPSTTGRAALFLPVFLALAGTLRDARIIRALALLIPSVILLSACAALTGAGAHVAAAGFAAQLGGARLDYLGWAVLGLPFAIISSVAATTAILRLFLDRETRERAPTLPQVSSARLDGTQRRVATIVVASLPALLAATVLGIDPAVAALGTAALLTLGPFRALPLRVALRAIEWKLLAFLLATLLMGEALVGSGAARAIAADVMAGLGPDALARPLVVAVACAAIALLAHLVVTSRSARVVVLVPMLATPLAALGYDPTAVILLVTIGTGFCQTLPVSAKAVALYATLKQPTYTPRDLLRLAAVLLPVQLVLLGGFAMLVWPLLGVALKP